MFDDSPPSPPAGDGFTGMLRMFFSHREMISATASFLTLLFRICAAQQSSILPFYYGNILRPHLGDGPRAPLL